MSESRVRKAVIPAAGLGTRFLPATKATPKALLPVVDKAAIQYVVEEAVAAGLSDIVIVIGPDQESVKQHFEPNRELERHLESAGKHAELEAVRAIGAGAELHYVVQERPLGLGHAVAMARDHVGDEPFAVLLADDLMDRHSTVLADMIDVHTRRGGSVIALREFPPEEISLYGCVGFDRIDERLVQVREVVEKPSPELAPSNLSILGRYVFAPAIFDALDCVEPGRGGEIQLTDAIPFIFDDGVLGWIFEHGRYDSGNKLGYLRATVEFALDRDDLADDFRAFLFDVVERERAARSAP